ncbi:conjugal transfer protein TraS [Roseateles saccharophilus]|uniref:MobA/VirD2-like nuclease domain-containing protein n=1 Tax=Roseateles saccharophilus TaxID=304 RepID=A0A4R3UIJ1_ROSSA|nr:conjugal transfer protein TraS [Roseateles saccharophilus]MDG0834868.1 conjugal transfer protein TraS [Roseateles saccharophilus]TCU88402.1 hypothetical protein EV671_103928 [Roseateles saccharophilus]
MSATPAVDAVLVRWGERLFYPRLRIVKPDPTPRLGVLTRRKAVLIRNRIEAVVVRHAPEVVVKVAGGGRGMRAIADQFDYISRDGTLDVEDDRGEHFVGREALRDLAVLWRYGCSTIEEVSHRREALNVTLSMPRGTDPELVLQAARAFARTELADYRYVMVLHDKQANPHVHLAVRMQSRSGERIDAWPERHRWRETFAAQLRSLGVDAEATSQALRGANRKPESAWRRKAREDAEPLARSEPRKSGERYYRNRGDAMLAWAQIMSALAGSAAPEDRELAWRVGEFIRQTPFIREVAATRKRPGATLEREPRDISPSRGSGLTRTEPDLER